MAGSLTFAALTKVVGDDKARSSDGAGSEEWLASVVEEVIEPDGRSSIRTTTSGRPGGSLPYGLAELWRDPDSGHRIEKTVFVECRAYYRRTDPSTCASSARPRRRGHRARSRATGR